MRIEVYYKKPHEDGRVRHQKKTLELSGISVQSAVIIDVYLIHNGPDITEPETKRLFCDTVAQDLGYDVSETGNYGAGLFPWDLLVEVAYKPGVTDPVGLTARKTLELEYGPDLEAAETLTVRTARQYLFVLDREAASPGRIAEELYNPLIQQAVVISREEWNSGTVPPGAYDSVIPPSSLETEHIALDTCGDEELQTISRDRLLALNLEEMQAIQAYYSSPQVRKEREKLGLPYAATDVELEMIAQTWSEHCKHKIFQADIEYSSAQGEEKPDLISSLFNTYIKKTTEEVGKEKKFLRSVFHDNSGVVQFHKDYCLCFKAETHNSPSALDPYGGAITGIVGVNRDILGTGKGAKPIFNTNVLCFGDPRMPAEEIPEGLLHPEKIMHGVHQGIIDGGNQSGIPTAAGAFLFDESYTGKPLVFCGTGGILPAEINGEASWINHIEPGDLAVMIGGRIGKDGIHGATFSSQELSEESPTSAVQIGDPITQKKMTDFLLEARDRGLYKGITDNGAGGLSSSLGEMAETSGGVRIELDKCPLKYPGLAPWEILVSESQERMSLAVSEDTVTPFMELAKRLDVEAAVVGRFTDTGFIEIAYNNKPVGYIRLEFLHDGLPKMHLKAVWSAPERKEAAHIGEEQKKQNAAHMLKTILAEPNVASKEHFVRQYDHEVQAGSIVKPFCGPEADGPTDGAVLQPRYGSDEGITVTHGICPRYGDLDTYHMAMCAVDEALRAHVALGGDPETACALDNFCWPDPVQSEQTPDGHYKLAQLVRACQGLYDACTAYGLPLVSGKDSMKNDARIGNKKVSVRPTLLISLMGLVPDMNRVVTTDCRHAGDAVFVLGETRNELGGSVYEKCSGEPQLEVPKVNPVKSMELYMRLHRAISSGFIHSCHDCSDGGLAVALAETAMGGRLGMSVDINMVPGTAKNNLTDTEALFSESPSRFVITVSPANLHDIHQIFEGCSYAQIGFITAEDRIVFRRGNDELVELAIADLLSAWNSFGAREE